MFKRLACVCLLAAWLCASDAMLEMTQVFAWSRMFVRYARTLSIADAAARTMDPEKPCAICMAVRRAREAGRREQPATAPTPADKLLVAQAAVDPFLLKPNRPEWSVGKPLAPLSWCEPVPVPPPRAPIPGSVG